MPAQVIELIGAAGVGKSSVNAELDRIDTVRWMNANEALRSPRAGFAGAVARALSAYSLGTKRRFEACGWMSPRAVDLQDALDRRSRDWQSFLDFILSLDLSGSRPTSQVLLGLKWLIRSLERRAMLGEIESSVVVLDDKPTSFPASFLASIGTWELRVRYAELVPVPGAIVHLEAPTDVVAERLRRRAVQEDRVIRRHNGIPEVQLERVVDGELTLARTIVGTLRQRGVPVLEVDATRNINELGDEVARFLSRIEASGFDVPR